MPDLDGLCKHGRKIEECWQVEESESVMGDGPLLERAAARALLYGDTLIASFLTRAREAMHNMGRDEKTIDVSRHYAVYYAHKIAEGIVGITNTWRDGVVRPITWEVCKNCGMPVYHVPLGKDLTMGWWVHQTDSVVCQKGKPYGAEVMT